MRLLRYLLSRSETVREFGPDGFDRYGFDRAGLHRDTRDRFGPDGYDCNGIRRPRQTKLEPH
ncbi:MAG: hypothetical protein WD638_09090 [Nitriliruptoraceae bacterium]